MPRNRDQKPKTAEVYREMLFRVAWDPLELTDFRLGYLATQRETTLLHATRDGSSLVSARGQYSVGWGADVRQDAVTKCLLSIGGRK
jgi:hypothetical protein